MLETLLGVIRAIFRVTLSVIAFVWEVLLNVDGDRKVDDHDDYDDRYDDDHHDHYIDYNPKSEACDAMPGETVMEYHTRQEAEYQFFMDTLDDGPKY